MPDRDPKITAEPGLAAHTLACNRGGRMVFQDLDFALGPGSAMLLRGPNGSGKSSLLRLIAGFLYPVAGNLTWNGENVDDDPNAHHGRLHYVGHLDPVKPGLTVAENLTTLSGMMGQLLDADAALTHFGLYELRDIPARFLSAGQRRRLNLSRLGAAGRPLWLLDEPTIGLDLAAVEQLEALITEHRRAGGIAIVATHIGLKLESALELTLDRASAGAAA